MLKQRTAECVTPKHPDKMCDQVSDAILDYFLTKDPNARVAVETLGGHGRFYILGEVKVEMVTTNDELQKTLEEIVHRVTGDNTLKVEWNLELQSQAIANGVDIGGAGDQGIMRGYATAETESLMPIEYDRARALCKYLYQAFGPCDGKTQVTVDEHGAMLAIVASFQGVRNDVLEQAINDWVFEIKKPVKMDCKIFANPAGYWTQGGFDADTGLTGRKLMVDNYGPQVPIGGGAFSGKDATKVDRSAAYMARKIAVDYLTKRNAKEVSVELAYAIGMPEPVQATVTVDGATEAIEGYDLTPRGIIAALGLKAPQYEKTAQWGHFGNGFQWDKAGN